MEHQYIRTNGVTLHVAIDGDPNGEPIVLLHGFPEFWYGWKKQIPYLVEKGYRVIVPDQRGYNLSDKPNKIEDYLLNVLANDIIGLIDALGYDRVNLVGHDWGGAVAWWVATAYPNRLKTLSILNIPYPTVMVKYLKANPAQWLKSWYMGFFQVPLLPEATLGIAKYKVFANLIKSTGKEGSFTEADLVKYREAWSKPNAATGMLNWYRGLMRTNVKQATDDTRREELPKGKRISTPTQILWGEKDVALSKEMAQPSADVCVDARLEFFPEATHWLQHDEPDAVNERIHAFIQEKLSV